MTDKANAREIVLDMLLEVIEGDKYSNIVLSQTLKKYQELDKKDRAFISRLFTGTLERCLTIDYVINSFSSIAVKKMKPVIRNLLRVSVYQLMYMDHVPESAVCNEAVKLTKKRGFLKLSGFVNANLRNIARNMEQVRYPEKEENKAGYLEVTYSVPEWLAGELLDQYPLDQVERMLADTFKEKGTSIRCNLTKATPEQLMAALKEEGVSVEKGRYLEEAFIITGYDYLESLKAFKDGLFTVQDESSMLVCQAAGIKEEDMVIDVCAAPGGKALHAAEKAKTVSARDLSQYKVKLIEENRERMGITNVEICVWDAAIDNPADHNRADVVIADLPCSGLGVLGKKPDIKYKMTQNQQKELVILQRNILSTISEYVKRGGVLIYSTCTVNREENIENRDWFLENFDYEADSLDPYLPVELLDEGTKKGYLQLLQGVHDTDGFFISRMRRRESL